MKLAKHLLTIGRSARLLEIFYASYFSARLYEICYASPTATLALLLNGVKFAINLFQVYCSARLCEIRFDTFNVYTHIQSPPGRSEKNCRTL